MCSWKRLSFAGVFCVIAVVASSAQTLTTIYNFCSQSGCSDGGSPMGRLAQGSDGNFYGTTYAGGSGNGTVFKLTPGGSFTLLHSFTGADGGQPYAGVLQGHDGAYYGVTTIGGNTPASAGTAFKVTAGGSFTNLHSFAGNPSDGGQPRPPMMLASDGNFYGTTYVGGANNLGTVFKMTPAGAVTILHSFCDQPGCADGSKPYAGLLQASDGYLYGETISGGAHNYGSIFKISTSGALTTLYSFCSQVGCSDGIGPDGGLLQTSDGNFYGTTTVGGTHAYGTVFAMTQSGTLSTLYSFCASAGCADGAVPYAGLTLANDGNLYGTTFQGGARGSGTVFGVTPSGGVTTFYSFCSQGNCTDGAYPYAGLVKASDGKLYGVTEQGGTHNQGAAFSIEINGDTLTVSVSGSGSVASTDGFIQCPGTCGHIYPHNTPVTLNATAASGWAFASWGGACSGNGSCNLTMTQNQSVSATFTQLSYTLTVSTNGNGTVTSRDGFINCPGTCSHSYLSNTLVTLNANPAQGWSLDHWAGACSGHDSSCVVNMVGNESVSATFTQNSYTLTVSTLGNGTVTSADGFIHCPGTCSHTYLSLTPVTLNASPAQGWSFSGWSGACTGVGPCNLVMTGNLAASAFFNQPGNGVRFSSVVPCRLLDTRRGNGGGGPINGGTYQTFNLAQLAVDKGCADLSSAAVFSLNVTLVPVNHAPVAYLTIWPTGLAQPRVSTMNSLDGRVKANAAIVPAGSNSSVNVYVTNTTDVVIDIDGYFAALGQATLQFYPLTPCRVADTRKSDFPQGLGTPHLSEGVARDFPVMNSACIPNNVTPAAYSFNLTAIPYPGLGNQLGYLEVWPTGQQPQHPVSTLNNPTGTFVANAAIVPAGTNNQITAYAASDTDLAIDINGYFAAPASGGLSLYPTAPCRVIDTRYVGNGQPFTGTLVPPVDVAGSPCAPPNNAEAYVFNATVVPSPTLSYLTLWPNGQNQPVVSTLNAEDGYITSNMAIVPSTDGKVDAFAAGTTHLILDISSYFAP